MSHSWYDLGCRIPSSWLTINKGDYVVDLGCGAVNDCFIARSYVRGTGIVMGIYFTLVMLKKAWENLDNQSFNNDIEDIPVKWGIIDVIISNCVINLVENKEKVFSKIFRILKPNGFFSISDVVFGADLLDKLKAWVYLYAVCVSGAVTKQLYLNKINKACFKTEVRKEKEIVIPVDILEKCLNKQEIEKFDLHFVDQKASWWTPKGQTV